jgi:uncharacterized protein YgbK (DUF1537 family)
VTAPLVAFYGDDLTGSTDTLSVLALAGLRVLLFLDLPDAAALQAAGTLDAIGIAGASRMMSPAQMDAHLPGVYQALKATGACLVHYKTCSTFDSAPQIGSIGHAINLGRTWFRPGFVPVVVGQPEIGRYCLFGTLFATASSGGPVHRLDRHPTMARHPVTPMHEADLRQILLQQGLQSVASLDVVQLRSDAAAATLAAIQVDAPDAILFDVLEESDFGRIGRLIGAALSAGEPLLGIGSSGLQQALLAGWQRLTAAARRPPRVQPEAAPVFVVSGSRSPVTAAQIEMAAAGGFALLALDANDLADPDRGAGRLAAASAEAAVHLAAGCSVIAHTSLGPDDPRALREPSRDRLEFLAEQSGRLVRAVLAKAPLRRIGIAGGDTSSLAARALGVRALEYRYRLAPGVPVCRVRESEARLNGLEIMLKGGQMGPADIFARLAAGQAG